MPFWVIKMNSSVADNENLPLFIGQYSKAADQDSSPIPETENLNWGFRNSPQSLQAH
jgi:hypothetical protein